MNRETIVRQRGELHNYYSKEVIKIGDKIKYPIFTYSRSSFNNLCSGDAFDLCHHLSDKNNPYGLMNVDSHLPKDSEWGAIAYLAYSKYGTNGNDVAINDVYALNAEYDLVGATGFGGNSGYLAKKEIDYNQLSSYENNWTSEAGKKASTTGNEYGVYDLSGGLQEWTSGILENMENNEFSKYGYNIMLAYGDKYVSKYKGNGTGKENFDNAENKLKVGDGVWDFNDKGDSVNTFNGDYCFIVFKDQPFSIRGGNYDLGGRSGLFTINSSTGRPCYCRGFRAVIIPN